MWGGRAPPPTCSMKRLAHRASTDVGKDVPISQKIYARRGSPPTFNNSDRKFDVGHYGGLPGRNGRLLIRERSISRNAAAIFKEAANDMRRFPSKTGVLLLHRRAKEKPSGNPCDGPSLWYVLVNTFTWPSLYLSVLDRGRSSLSAARPGGRRLKRHLPIGCF